MGTIDELLSRGSVRIFEDREIPEEVKGEMVDFALDMVRGVDGYLQADGNISS